MNPLAAAIGFGVMVTLILANKSGNAAPSGTVTPKTPKQNTPSDIEPLANVPLVIAERCLKLSQIDGAGNITWLIDNGWPKTAEALDQFYQGNKSADDVRKIAESEWLARLTG